MENEKNIYGGFLSLICPIQDDSNFEGNFIYFNFCDYEKIELDNLKENNDGLRNIFYSKKELELNESTQIRTF
jgi:hypothetical protein